MKNYTLVYSEQAMKDVDELYNFITIECNSPYTAKKYINGLFKTIDILSKQPESFSVATRKSIQRVDSDIRRINYKKISILYSVSNEIVYIHRIMASSLIV